jgi:hypothetical protein
MNNVIFIHAALLNRCEERIIQYLTVIKNSEIKYDCIYICYIGNGKIPDIDFTGYNIKTQLLSSELSDYEVLTLQFLYDFCLKNPTHNVLYIHTKNVGKEINYCIEDQIEYMLHFLITKWETCMNHLISCDACGVDLRNEPTLHFSGNFWWSTANNIIDLPSPREFNNIVKYPNPLNSIRHNQEFWICYNKKQYISLWDCGINVYERHLHRYPKELYSSL